MRQDEVKLITSAMIGDSGAFKTLISSLQQLRHGQRAGEIRYRSGADEAAFIDGIRYNGPPGNKLDGIAANLEQAQYNEALGLWEVTAPSYSFSPNPPSAP